MTTDVIDPDTDLYIPLPPLPTPRNPISPPVLPGEQLNPPMKT